MNFLQSSRLGTQLLFLDSFSLIETPLLIQCEATQSYFF